jgi:ATP phosphoribosyltransferase regulatory subunit
LPFKLDDENINFLYDAILQIQDKEECAKFFEDLCTVNELKSIMDLLKGTEYSENIRIDFSIVNDMNYYNGIVFNGFIEGICETVLFGGRYDKMLKKMNKSSRGIGFALYLDLLESLYKEFTEYDVDALILYDEAVDVSKLDECVHAYVSSGKRVSAQKSIPTKLRYKEIVDIRGEAK